MKFYGITKKLDGLGRIVLPKEYRKLLGLNKFDITMTYLLDDGILIKKYERGCSLCESKENLTKFNEKFICKDCIEKIKNVT